MRERERADRRVDVCPYDLRCYRVSVVGGVGGVECMTWFKHLQGTRRQIRQVEGLWAVIMGSGSPSTAPTPERISCCGGRLASVRRAESALPLSDLQTGSCLYLTGVTSCLNIQPPQMIPAPQRARDRQIRSQLPI